LLQNGNPEKFSGRLGSQVLSWLDAAEKEHSRSPGTDSTKLHFGGKVFGQIDTL
jgi:hypothetical protein